MNRRIGIVGGKVHDPFIKPPPAPRRIETHTHSNTLTDLQMERERRDERGERREEREREDLAFPPFRA